ncbi:MAG: restriction endonuclease [Okeania sp. SIO2C2]|uniref:restriction endonuclease n=1 Tax=Okeania sp. SIO2C2 TaxID=2607787 RepID=UPI0013B7611B|nr:restriction endonuclease [Okeania sp. SIO2C2]NEP91229.1 restriction endonuclease [Okeania sp. SIO2C2]
MVNNKDIQTKFKVVIPIDWDNNKKGTFWEKTVADLFRQQRLEISPRIRFTGSEIDVLAKNKETNERAFIECKFYEKDTISAEVIDKLLGKAYRNNIKKVYLACTTEFGKEAKGVIEEEQQKYQNANYDGIRAEFWGPEKLAQVFMDIKSIKLPDWNKYNIGKVNTATLLVTSSQTLWVVEEIGEEAIPIRAIVFPTKEDQEITNLEELKSNFKNNGFLSGLPIIDSKTIQKKSLKIPTVGSF